MSRDIGSMSGQEIMRIIKERDDLQLWKDALETYGIDNWQGYDEAIALYRELKQENRDE